jgi:hypothetical protein
MFKLVESIESLKILAYFLTDSTLNFSDHSPILAITSATFLYLLKMFSVILIQYSIHVAH